jgi:hypothetical protein
LAPFSFAAGNFSRQRVEVRQPGRPEPVEPVVDLDIYRAFDPLSWMELSFVPEGNDAERKLLMWERGV